MSRRAFTLIDLMLVIAIIASVAIAITTMHRHGHYHVKLLDPQGATVREFDAGYVPQVSNGCHTFLLNGETIEWRGTVSYSWVEEVEPTDGR